MSLTCPNCTQTILPKDTVCWHCGYRLSPQFTKKRTPSETVTTIDSSVPLSFSAAMVYGGVTAVIIITLFLTMRTLGQKPLVQLHPDTNINTGWLPVTDQALRFTFDIPPTWQVWERQNPQQQTEFEALLVSDAQLTTSVTPLSEAISDMEILMIVMGARLEQVASLPGFVILARSEELSHLSLDEIISLAQENNTTIIINEIAQFRSFVGDNRVSFLVELPQTKDELSCQHHVITSEIETYLLAGCAPKVRSAVYREPLDKILASFQPLR